MKYHVFRNNKNSGIYALTADELKGVMSTGNTYINLHTSENPGGWIRGRMIPRGSTTNAF